MHVIEPEKVGFDAGRLAAVADMAQRDIDAGRYDGATLAVGRRGELAALDAVGFADRAAGTDLTPDTRFVAFSIAKQFTNVVVLRWVERGLLSLYEPVADVLPEFGQRGKERVALWHLLTHTGGVFSGIPPLPPEDLMRFEAWTEYACGARLENPPGSRVVYSLLAGHAVMASMVVATDPAGRSFRRIVAEELLEPLGMTSTSLGPPTDGVPVAPVVARYGRDAGLFTPAEVESLGPLVLAEGSEIPGGGFVTTVGDLHRFADMLRGGGERGGTRILSPVTVDLVQRPMSGAGSNSLLDYATEMRNWQPFPANVGIGFFVRGEQLSPGPLPNLGSPATFGGWGAGTSCFWIDPVRDVCFSLITTGVMEDSDHVARVQKLSDMALAALVER
ncbi:MAG: serine hydrolase domain-containing protein [Actinomycetota bacterium]|nr:serine hydrolase domain-containing protein [Actinomycetota bacterium]